MTVRENAESPFPEVFQGAVVTEPALSGDEWNAICAQANVTLAPDIRDSINRALWWCKWETQNLDAIPRSAKLKQQLQAFIKGVDIALSAIGYLEEASLLSTTAGPPTDVRVTKLPQGQAWMALSGAAWSDSWRGGYWTKRALQRAKGPDEALQALHALAFAAGRAVVEWSEDKGGQRRGGDLHFIQRLLQILVDADVVIAYQHDRTADDGVGMTGPGWCLLLGIWSMRNDSFKAGEQSTLANYYRQAHKSVRNEPRQIFPSQFP